MKNLFFIISIILISISSCVVGENPVLKIEGGKIQGIPTKTSGVYVYKGIPYAAPPVRDLRWKSPQPVIPWDGGNAISSSARKFLSQRIFY